MEHVAISLNQIFGWSIFSSFLVACLISALWSIYFNRIKEGQRTEFQKQIEELKAKQSRLNYITQAQFDAEFKMYQELSEAKFNAILESSRLFPYGLDKLPSDEEERKSEYLKRYKLASSALIEFQNLLFKYAPFIEEKLYQQFEDLRILIQQNVNWFPDLHIDEYLSKTLPFEIRQECTQRTKEMYDKQETLIKDLREYLKSLKIQEGK